MTYTNNQKNDAAMKNVVLKWELCNKAAMAYNHRKDAALLDIYCCLNFYSCNAHLHRGDILVTNCFVVPFSLCCISPLYKYKVLFKSTYANIKVGGKTCFSKNSKKVSVSEKNLEKKAKLVKNHFQIPKHMGLRGEESSKFYKNSRRCTKTITNGSFRSDLNILLPYMIKSKIHSLKRFISISRGILNLEQSSISNDSVKIAKIYPSFKKGNLPPNHFSSKSIHSSIGEKLC